MGFFDDLKTQFKEFFDYLQKLVADNWLDIFKYILSLVLGKVVQIENQAITKDEAREEAVATARRMYPKESEQDVRIAIEESVKMVKRIGFNEAQQFLYELGRFKAYIDARGEPVGGDSNVANFTEWYLSRPDKK